MSKKEYTKGMKVRVREDLELNKPYGTLVTTYNHTHLAGKEVTISKHIGGSYYRIDEDPSYFDSEMFADL